MISSVRVCMYCQFVHYRWVRRYVCACTVILSAVDGFFGTCVHVLSVRLLLIASSVRVCMYFSPSAVDCFVGTGVRVLSVRLL